MSHLPLDARAILQHLNELGYRNISAEQLREFLKDLRRLIKYEERLATNSKEDYFSSLYKRDTISSRAKMGDREKENAPHQIDKDKSKQQNSDDNKERLNSGKAATDTNLKLATLFREQLLIGESKEPPTSSNCARRSRSKTKNGPSTSEACPNQDTRIPHQSKLRKSRARSNSRLSAQVCNQAKHKRSDPVALYQYYQNEWSHFRDRIPGENSHTDLRWEIRHKLIPK